LDAHREVHLGSSVPRGTLEPQHSITGSTALKSVPTGVFLTDGRVDDVPVVGGQQLSGLTQHVSAFVSEENVVLSGTGDFSTASLPTGETLVLVLEPHNSVLVGIDQNGVFEPHDSMDVVGSIKLFDHDIVFTLGVLRVFEVVVMEF
jgi:hypothetical protein